MKRPDDRTQSTPVEYLQTPQSLHAEFKSAMTNHPCITNHVLPEYNRGVELTEVSLPDGIKVTLEENTDTHAWGLVFFEQRTDHGQYAGYVEKFLYAPSPVTGRNELAVTSGPTASKPKNVATAFTIWEIKQRILGDLGETRK